MKAIRKDCWDKLDVCSKWVVPIIVAISVYLWNLERTQDTVNASMISIAVGVLKQPASSEDDPLRDWAVEVLQRPSQPPALPKGAVLQLKSGRTLGPIERAVIDGELYLLPDELRSRYNREGLAFAFAHRPWVIETAGLSSDTLQCAERVVVENARDRARWRTIEDFRDFMEQKCGFQPNIIRKFDVLETMQ